MMGYLTWRLYKIEMSGINKLKLDWMCRISLSMPCMSTLYLSSNITAAFVEVTGDKAFNIIVDTLSCFSEGGIAVSVMLALDYKFRSLKLISMSRKAVRGYMTNERTRSKERRDVGMISSKNITLTEITANGVETMDYNGYDSEEESNRYEEMSMRNAPYEMNVRRVVSFAEDGKTENKRVIVEFKDYNHIPRAFRYRTEEEEVSVSELTDMTYSEDTICNNGVHNSDDVNNVLGGAESDLDSTGKSDSGDI